MDLVEALELSAVKCWIAPRDVRPGAVWSEEIIEGIEASRTFVLLLSDASNLSDAVLREVERAAHMNKPIYPVRIEDVQPARRLEFFVSAHHWFDALEGMVADQLARLGTAIASAENCVAGDAPANLETDDQYIAPLLFDPPILPAPVPGEAWENSVTNTLANRLNSFKISRQGKTGFNPLLYAWTGTDRLVAIRDNRRVFSVSLASSLVLRNYSLPVWRGLAENSLAVDRFGRAYLVGTTSVLSLERGLGRKLKRINYGQKLGAPKCIVAPLDFSRLIIAGSYQDSGGETFQVSVFQGDTPYASWSIDRTKALTVGELCVSSSLSGKYIGVQDRCDDCMVLPTGTASGPIDPSDYRPKVGKEVRFLSMAWHPRHDVFACGYLKDGKHGFYVFDAATREVVFEQELPRRGQTRSTDWSPDGRFLALGGEDQAIFLWDFHRNRSHKLLGHENTVTRVHFSPDGQRLLTDAFGGEEKTLIWDPLNPDQPVFSCPLSTVGIFGSPWSTDGRRFAGFGSYPGDLAVYRLKDGAFAHQ